MNRNTLTLIIGGLIVVIAVIGYMLYQEQHRAGIEVEVEVNDNGISVQTN
jgi:hypothetical protein